MNLTTEQCEKLRNANDALRGTSDYNRYYMCCTLKSKSGRWVFANWSVPRRKNVTVKTIKGVMYLYERDEFFPNECVFRYEVNDAVKELLNL